MLAQIEQTFRASESLPNVVARLANVSKSYGTVRALNRVNLEVYPGEILAVLGPNGAGKTTAVKLLLGLAAPNSGEVSVFGGDPRNPANRMRTGAMLQVARVPETLKVREHVDLFSSYYPKPLPVSETLAAAGLTSIQNRKFGDLSGGQKQRLLFALAICGDPDLLFLDEATLGLDVEARRLLWDQIRNLAARGKTVLLTTHYLQEADALADRILVINRGEIIAQGTPAEIKARTAGRQIRCHTELPLQDVRAIPGVLEANEQGDMIVVQTAVAEPVLRELLARDPYLTSIEVTSAGLEEAFLALTTNQANGSN
jgi:ABC-2 type transport system ATP-binding protein